MFSGRNFGIPPPPNLLQKNSLQRKCFGAIHFVKITKESLYKANSLACFLAKGGHARGSNITKKIFWWNYCCNNYKNYYKWKCSKELFCNNFGQDGNRKGATTQAAPQKCVRGHASGATVRSRHALRAFVYSTIETRHLIRIRTGLDTYRIRIHARLRCVWKRFVRGTPRPRYPLTIVPETKG